MGGKKEKRWNLAESLSRTFRIHIEPEPETLASAGSGCVDERYLEK